MEKVKNTERQHLSTLFAGNLNNLRTERGLSMKRAAADLGVAKSTWCQWENGNRFPPGFFLELLTEYFDVPACRFLALHPDRCFPDKPGWPADRDKHQSRKLVWRSEGSSRRVNY